MLRGILPREYYIHYSLLVVGCRLLCGMKISSNDIDRAQQLLVKFYERHELLYGMYYSVEIPLRIHSK